MSPSPRVVPLSVIVSVLCYRFHACSVIIPVLCHRLRVMSLSSCVFCHCPIALSLSPCHVTVSMRALSSCLCSVVVPSAPTSSPWSVTVCVHALSSVRLFCHYHPASINGLVRNARFLRPPEPLIRSLFLIFSFSTMLSGNRKLSSELCINMSPRFK